MDARTRRAAFPALLFALAFAGCASIRVSAGREITLEEQVLRSGIRSYYDEMSAAFAAGSPDLLANLFDPGIARPMTQDQIKKWAQDFFQKHGPAGFKVLNVEYEQVGHVSAVVVVTYRVETRDGAGSFAGRERDYLVQRQGRRWYVTAWDKIPETSR